MHSPDFGGIVRVRRCLLAAMIEMLVRATKKTGNAPRRKPIVMVIHRHRQLRRGYESGELCGYLQSRSVSTRSRRCRQGQADPS
jgi:hypothetical protein